MAFDLGLSAWNRPGYVLHLGVSPLHSLLAQTTCKPLFLLMYRAELLITYLLLLLFCLLMGHSVFLFWHHAACRENILQSTYYPYMLFCISVFWTLMTKFWRCKWRNIYTYRSLGSYLVLVGLVGVFGVNWKMELKFILEKVWDG